MKKNKKYLFLGFIGILFLGGASFALWSLTWKQDDVNMVSSACFHIEYKDQDEIHLSSVAPITDETGKDLHPYTFTITNTCDTYASYQIHLESLKNSTLKELQYIKSMLNDDSPILLTENKSVNKTLEDAERAYLLKDGYLDAKSSKTFTLRLWMDYDTPAIEEVMNKTFYSKITIVTSYVEDYDREIPVVQFTTLKEDNKVIIDASSSTDNTQIKYYYYSKDGVNFTKTNADHYTFENQPISYGNAVKSLIELEKNTINEVFVRVEDDYGNMSEIKSEVVGDLLYDETIDNNLRYIGATPNNYVDFNGEKWRIIGVMNNVEDAEGNTDSRIKLIRAESIGNFSWDTSSSDINIGQGVNEWSQAKVKILLNEGGPYWDKRIGYCYNGRYNENYKCDFTSKGLMEEAKTMIQSVVWPIGSNGNQNYSTMDIENYYTFERSNASGKICNSGSGCTDTVSRTTKWTGYVGLMYPSDHGYATSGSKLMNYRSCYEDTFYHWNEECYKNSWLDIPDVKQFTMTPLAYKNIAVYAFHILNDNCGAADASEPNAIRPVVFLNSNISISDGNGSENNPFLLSIN